MNENDIPNEQQIDEICQSFKQTWDRKTNSDFSTFLEKIDARHQLALLKSLLKIDVDLYINSGKFVFPAEYDCHGSDATEIVERYLRSNNLDCLQNLNVLVLCFRIGLLSEDQVVSAVQTWVAAKQKPIPEVLFYLNFLTEANWRSLLPIMESFACRYAGKLDECLSFNASISKLREKLSAIPDSDIQTAIVHLSDNNGKDRYQIIGFLDEGGLGRVSIAVDQEIDGRKVAFKEIQEEIADDDIFRERFVSEAQITGRLEHPGIVPVYSLGQYPNGRPFYAMRLIQGESFAKAIDKFHTQKDLSKNERRFRFRELLERFLNVCDAVEYAHSRNVIHRDLKPANIMIGQFGETLVVDWGLAKVLNDGQKEQDKPDQIDNSAKTRAPQKSKIVANPKVVEASEPDAKGSPPFMSPEQAAAQSDLGPATDIFALGAILYCLISGEPPYSGRNRLDLILRASNAEFVPIQELAPDTPKGLADICERAMLKDPDDRFQSAHEMRSAIVKWLVDEPLSPLLATVTHFENLVDEYPEQSEYQVRLVTELTSLSKVYRSTGRFEEAAEISFRAVEMAESLSSFDNLDIQRFQELFYARSQYAAALKELDQEDEANRYENKNADELKSLQELIPHSRQIRDEMVKFSCHLGLTLEKFEEIDAEYREDHESEPWQDALPPTDLIDEFKSQDDVEALTDHGIDRDSHLEPTVHPWVANGDSDDPTPFEGRYRLESVLGEGGSSTVYLAHDSLLPRTVALKRARAGLDPSIEKHLQRESFVNSLLDHSNIIPVMDAGRTESGEYFFVMKFVDGDICEWTKNGLFAGKERDNDQGPRWKHWLLNLFPDICDAIQHAHERGIVHGDIKPRNFFADESSRMLWIFDWSLSRVVSPEKLQRHFDISNHPQREFILDTHVEGQIMGTPAYMSAEQAQGMGTSFKSDIFGLGASLYTLLTSKAPYEFDYKQGIVDFLKQAIEGKFAKPRSINPSIPKRLEKICLKAMALDPDQRYATAAEMATDIRKSVR